MSLILNETLKLQANALDRASTACLTVGVLAPIAAAIYNLSGARLDIWIYVVVAAVWFFGRICPTSRGKTNFERSAAMTGLQFFAFIVLPIVVVAGGWAIVLYTEHKYHIRPGK